MLNKRPIFIVALARGGSNILLNMLRSHPDLCSPRGETHQVFKGKPDESFRVKLEKKIRYFPIILSEGMDVFSTSIWRERRPFREFTKNKIDQILFAEKLKAKDQGQNKFKHEEELYTDDEIINSRLLTKNLNGLIFLSHELKKMYPDATFFALVRNGYAVCEGILRRSKNPNNLIQIAENYNKACQQMISDSESISNFFIYRYEDLVRDPWDNLKKIYNHGDLDITIVKKVRLESKKVMNDNGNYNYINNQKNKQLFWYDMKDLHNHLVTDANENQTRRLNNKQKDLIREKCAQTLEYFDY